MSYCQPPVTTALLTLNYFSKYTDSMDFVQINQSVLVHVKDSIFDLIVVYRKESLIILVKYSKSLQDLVRVASRGKNLEGVLCNKHGTLYGAQGMGDCLSC